MKQLVKKVKKNKEKDQKTGWENLEETLKNSHPLESYNRVLKAIHEWRKKIEAKDNLPEKPSKKLCPN